MAFKRVVLQALLADEDLWSFLESELPSIDREQKIKTWAQLCRDMDGSLLPDSLRSEIHRNVNSLPECQLGVTQLCTLSNLLKMG